MSELTTSKQQSTWKDKKMMECTKENTCIEKNVNERIQLVRYLSNCLWCTAKSELE